MSLDTLLNVLPQLVGMVAWVALIFIQRKFAGRQADDIIEREARLARMAADLNEREVRMNRLLNMVATDADRLVLVGAASAVAHRHTVAEPDKTDDDYDYKDYKDGAVMETPPPPPTPEPPPFRTPRPSRD